GGGGGNEGERGWRGGMGAVFGKDLWLDPPGRCYEGGSARPSVFHQGQRNTARGHLVANVVPSRHSQSPAICRRSGRETFELRSDRSRIRWSNRRATVHPAKAAAECCWMMSEDT